MKVLVVEDDFIVRQGILLSLDWEKYGLQICGQAANGEAGWERVEELHPEIVLTDIKMPIMDGLQLAEKIKAKYPEIEIVIFSGFDDFTYAKQAIHLGVNEYLLKPIDAEELLKCVCNLKDAIQKRKAEQKEKQETVRLLKDNEIPIRDYLLSKVLYPAFNENQHKIMQDITSLGIELNGPKYKVLLLTVDDFTFLTRNSEEEEKNEIGEKIRTIVDDAFVRAKCKAVTFLNWRHWHFQIAIILNYVSISEFFEEDICKKIRDQIMEEPGFLSVFSCGYEKCNVAELSESYQEAVTALRSSKLYQKTGIRRFSEDCVRKEEVFLKAGNDENMVVECIQKYDVETMQKLCREIFEKTVMEETLERLKEVCIRLSVLMITNLEEMLMKKEISKLSLNEIIWEIQSHHTIDGLRKCMQKTLDQVTNVLVLLESEKYTMIIRQAMRFIEENYAQEISVISISSEVHVTPNYFSQIFKAQTGKKFIDYLNEFRVSKAKKFLRDTSMKVYEVAEKSGYPNYKYFNKVFKKMTGYSPREYRNEVITGEME